ncbi:cell division protein FtsQ/DivIB [Levilactobacillus tangyuanensis]|uniref:Cell division protein DivIB n=1 Tax=Levilactobacillus tangyuanensis TaxID=2486021 RepID=A0ABW1TM51_9LACO|nr:FtsQ-type POTRA domain-containing protein [Levilactobacillus tangyuanensis]
MKFRLNRHDDKQQKSLTPWEKYQEQQDEQKRQKKTPNWVHRAKRIGDKLPKLKHQRNLKLYRRLGLLLGVFTVVILAMVYLVSPLSHFQKITVRGAEALSAKQVQQAAGVRPGDSIFSVTGHESKVAKRAVKNNSRIKKARVIFAKPNHLTIRVVEYETAGYVMRDNRYDEVLENGIVSHQSVSQPKSGTPVYGNFKSSKSLHKMILQYAKLDADIKRSISEIQASPTKSNPNRLHLFMNDGNEVYATITNFSTKMAYYPGIAAKMKQKGVVNLEVGAYSYPFKK